MTLAALAAALAVAARPPAPALPMPSVARGGDGLEIVVLPLPEAAWSSLRLVVRAGGASDPAQKGGLAHLVEHLALSGSYDEDGRAFAADVRRAGGRLNAHTTPDLTKFELDAPAAAFPALAERLVKAVTSPAWERALIDAERGVIETETEYHESEGLLSLVDRAVFPSPLQAGPLAGTRETRGALSVEDAARFFADRYVPANVTVVLAGPIGLEDARGIVGRSFRIPPALPGDGAAAAEEAPLLPLQQNVPAGITVTLLGHALDRADVGACEPVAALLELRLVLALQATGPMVPSVWAGCASIRGTPFLMAAVYTTSFDAGDLPRAVDDAFAGIGTLPPSAAERAAVDSRLDRRERRLRADPALLTERVAALVAARDDARPLGDRIRHGRLPDAAALRRFAARSLGKGSRILVNVTPLQE